MGRLVRANRKVTTRQLTLDYNTGAQNNISVRTTRRTLSRMGYNSRRPVRVPLISTQNRKKRLQFARGHEHWTFDDWKKVCWSDESRFLLHHADGRRRIWRKQHEAMHPSCQVSTVQAGGGGVMVWGMFSWHTLGSLIPVEQRLNAQGYLNIVADQVHPFMATVFPPSEGYFQQDNAPCHKARIVMEWFQEHDNEFNLLLWPPQSPDLNPIEHLWDELERGVRGMDPLPSNNRQLGAAVASAWTNITEQCFQRLIESMPRRIRAVIAARGGPTRY